MNTCRKGWEHPDDSGFCAIAGQGGTGVGSIPGLLVLMWLLTCGSGRAVQADDPALEGVFRLGFSSATFSGVKDTDAKAAIKVWARSILLDRGVKVDPEPTMYNSVEAIAEALRDQRVEGITLNADEFWKIGPGLVDGPLIGGTAGGKTTEEFVLLVRRDGAIKRLELLPGHRVNVWVGTRARLAPIWLDTLLMQEGFASAAKVCEVKQVEKLSEALLPLFFGKVDACLVTQRGFKIMGEMNPQVLQRLEVLTNSPPYVPTGFCFRAGYTNSLKDTIIKEITKVQDTPAGQQVLNLYQSEALEVQPLSCLDSAFELLERHARLRADTNAVKRVVGGNASPLEKEGKP